MRLTARLLLPLLLATPAAAQPPAPPDAARAGAVADSLARERLTRDSVAGLVVGVYRAGRPVLRRAYGLADVEAGRAMTPDDALSIGSITKQLTAVAVLRLVEQGKVALDAPVATYLPELTRRGAVTVRQLLNQRSGLGRYEMAFPLLPPNAPAQVIAAIDAAEPEGAPGGRFSYNNANYYLLGELAARVAGDASWDAHLTRTLLAPTGLRATGACAPSGAAMLVSTGAERKAPVAGYAVGRPQGSAPGAAAQRGRGAPVPPVLVRGAGGLCSTIDDLARWSAALHGGRLLAPASYALLTTPPEGDRYAMGAVVTSVAGHRQVWHNGALTSGWNAQLAHFPDDSLTVVVLANSYPARPEALADAVARAALGLPAAPPPVAAPSGPPAGVRATGAALALGAYAGTYAVGPLKFVVTATAPGLDLLDPAGRHIALAHRAGDTFCGTADATFCLHFLVEGGRATTLLVDSPRAKAPPARRVE